jgi:hypothetical protein
MRYLPWRRAPVRRGRRYCRETEHSRIQTEATDPDLAVTNVSYRVVRSGVVCLMRFTMRMRAEGLRWGGFPRVEQASCDDWNWADCGRTSHVEFVKRDSSAAG